MQSVQCGHEIESTTGIPVNQSYDASNSEIDINTSTDHEGLPERDAVQADTTCQFSVSDVDNSSSESDSSINSEEDSHSTNILDDLSEWAITFNVPHATLSALLTILRRSDIDLPKDP